MSEDNADIHVTVTVPALDKDEILVTAAQVVARRCFPKIMTEEKSRELVRDEILTRVKERLDEIMSDVTVQLNEMAFPQTNTYGEVTGRSRTIREFCEEQVKTWFTQKVDSNGYPSNSGMSRADFMIKRSVEAYATKELKATIDATVLGAVKAVEDNLAKYVAEALNRTVGLKK